LCPPIGGRPTRAEAAAKGLKTLGINPEGIDPKRILSEIAVDTSAPAAARVAACKALLADAPKPAAEVDDLDPITRKALELLNAPSRLN
jgi:hypothetical protein